MKRNKCYYSMPLSLPTTLGAAFYRTTVFHLTQPTVGSVSQEKFGGWLQERPAVPFDAGYANARAQNTVVAFYQPTANGGLVASGPGMVSLTFLDGDGNVITDDPSMHEQLSLRVLVNRLITAAEFPGTALGGTIYVERQHSIEV